MIRSTSPNLATDESIVERVKTEMLPLARHCRNDRRTIRETWLRYWRIWSVQPDQEAYKGRVQNYIPIARREVELWVQRINQALFPPDTTFSVKALRQSLERKVPLVNALFRYYLDRNIQMKRVIKPWTRQLVTLGTSPTKVVWRVSERMLPVLRDLFNMDGDPIAVERTLEKVTDYIGPTFATTDLFGFYVWPTMVQDVEDAILVFEDILLDQQTIQAIGRRWLDPDDEDMGHVYENVDKVMDRIRANDTKDKVDAERRRLADRGFTHPMDAALPKDLMPVDLAEYVWRADLDDDGPKKWLVIVGAEDVVMRIQPVDSVWWTGTAPWLAGKFLEVENEFYGRSILETIDKLQYFTNDIANQASDALVWSLNPITVVDMFRMHDPTSLRMKPGAKWLGEPGGVEMKEPPKDSAVAGFNALGQIMSLVHDASTPGPISMPVGKQRSRSGQTAVAQQLNAAESMTPIREVVESIQYQVLNPFLHRMHVLSYQCLDRDLILQIASTDGAPMVERKISVPDIVGDFEFEWQAATAALNTQVRATQMTTFFGIASKIPPEMLQAEGVKLGWAYMLRAFWREGLQLPNAERAIVDLNKQVSIDPQIENDLFRLGRGQDVVVSEADDDQYHLQVHARHQDYDGMPKHMQAHQAAIQAKQIMQVRKQAQLQGLQNAARPPRANGAMGGTPNPGRPPTPRDVSDLFRSMPRGNA